MSIVIQNKCTALSTLPLLCLGLVSDFFFSVFHYSLSLQCALVIQLWFCFPESNQTLGLALPWL